MKKILLTGGNGFFCSRFKKRYEKQYEIISTNRDNLDITDAEKSMEVLKLYKPNYVIHAAGIAVTDFCDKNPEISHKINVEGAINVAQAAKEVGAKLIFLSTEQVFNGNLESGPYTEKDLPVPSTIYGKNKLEAEKLLKKIIDELWIIRFTWMFGLPEEGCNMASNILWDTFKNILKGEKIKASPNEFRGMTYVYEMIEEFPKIFEIPYGTYHMGSENPLNRYDVTKKILEKIGQKDIKNILIKDEKYAENSRDLRLDCSKIASFGINFTKTDKMIENLIEELNI